MKTSADGYALVASGTLPCKGIATSSRPKKTFWKPPGFPGCTTQATEGVSRPAWQCRCLKLIAGYLYALMTVSQNPRPRYHTISPSAVRKILRLRI